MSAGKKHSMHPRPVGQRAPTTHARGRQTEPSGVPRYVTARLEPRRSGAEQEAQDAARSWQAGEGARLTPLSGPISPLAADVARSRGAGRPLDEKWQSLADRRYGIDASRVRVHDDPAATRLAGSLGANALTVGSDIFFAAAPHAPSTPEGERVLAHELAHVAQQGGEPRAVQCDLGRSIAVPLGAFDVDMVTQAAAPGSNPGMRGTIAFDPDPNGPYSAEIGLVQAVNVTDVRGRTTPTPGDPANWQRISGGGEAGRMELMTQGSLTVPQGWFIDSRTAQGRGTSVGPNYIEHFISPEPQNQFGYLRSPTDVRRASLWDFPNMSFDVDFDFETVAKGTDNQTIYGSLFWGFGIRSGAVPPASEYAFASGAASATFEEALERFRGFFVHEPVVLYFDTDVDVPITGEETKLADVPDYLDRYPDVRVSIDGFADMRGGEAHNLGLSDRRVDSVRTILLNMGVDPTRITWTAGWGRVSAFSQHGSPSAQRQRTEAGLLRANRRVVVSFEHSMSGYPIVMP